MKFEPQKIKIYLSAMFLINLLAITMLYTTNNKLKIAQKKQNEFIKIFYENTKTRHGLYAMSPVVVDTIDSYKNTEFVTVCRIKRNQCNSCIRSSLSIIARLSVDDSSHNYLVVSSDFSKSFIIDKLKNMGANLDKIYFRNYHIQEFESSNMPYFFKIRNTDLQVVNLVISEWDREEITYYCVENFLKE